MNSVKRLVGILMAVMIAAIALPSLAAPQYTKQYSLTLTSSPVIALTVVADLKNEALGPGNSNISSYRYTFTGAAIDSATSPGIPAANIQVSGSSVFVTLPAPLKGGKHSVLTIVLKDCGDGIELPQSGVQVWTGVMGQTFSPINTTFPLTTSVVCGVLACGDDDVVPDSFNPGSVTVTRGDYDKNGNVAACAGIPYTYTSFDDNTLHFAWPDTITGNPHAAFELVVDASGGIPPAGTTGVGWLDSAGNPATTNPAVFLYGSALGDNAALNCLTQDLPAPYGTLNAAINAAATSLTINGVVAPPGASFPIVIINSVNPALTERMTAVYPPTSTVGGGPYNVTYTVTRGTATEGDPGNANKAAHAAGALVMSTPLPILPAFLPPSVSPPYVASTQAQMCIADQAVVGSDHSTTFISIGDPWGSQP